MDAYCVKCGALMIKVPSGPDERQVLICPFCQEHRAPKRKSRDEMFLDIARIVAERSTCSRAKVGAVAVRDKRVVSMGYAGNPSGLSHCIDKGCDTDEQGGCISTVHAEANVIAFAAKAGISLRGATMYSTHSPCYNCAKLIINSGIIIVKFITEYRSIEGLALLEKVNIKVHKAN